MPGPRSVLRCWNHRVSKNWQVPGQRPRTWPAISTRPSSSPKKWARSTTSGSLALGQVNGAGKRQVLMDVPFVKQHHATCAPATLAAVSAYWSVPAEHLEIAEEICYDGTPAHSQRRWAEQHGFVTREFRVTWEAVVALIDRRVPVLLGTLGPEMGHMQAVVGYDSLRRTLHDPRPVAPNRRILRGHAVCQPEGTRAARHGHGSARPSRSAGRNRPAGCRHLRRHPCSLPRTRSNTIATELKKSWIG